MPASLPPNARCPKCNTLLEAIVRTTDADGVTAEYFHVRLSWRARRRRRCVVTFDAALSDLEQSWANSGVVH